MMPSKHKRGSLFRVAVSAARAEQLAPAAEEGASAGRKHPLARTRAGKRTVSAYITPEAWRQLQHVVIEEGTTVQDLVAEGLNHVFAARGRSRIA